MPPSDLTPEVANLPKVSVKPEPKRIFPESAIAVPETNLASHKIAYDTILASRRPDRKGNAGWQYRRNRQGYIVGFEFSNSGGNPILLPRRDAAKNQFFTRDFQFRFDDRARQDIHLLVADWVPSRDRQFRLSELMNSLLHFFPRTVLPAIVNFGERNIVTLPTGEEVEFNAETNEIVGGVLSEAPVDLNPEGRGRRFPAIDYKGRGVLVRADARGTDPRLSSTALIFNNAATGECAPGLPCARCPVPARELWWQSGAVRFKFATDQEFDRFLRSRCGFGLPALNTDAAAATATR
ncbi:MAG TPA: hypothetical protein VMT22_09390 [Terriglobales bacterium]|nr:hypothetical protein [Terriglobales bacterium]